MAGPGPKFTGLWRDLENGRIYLYYGGTALTYWNASGQTAQSGMVQNFSAGTTTLSAGDIVAADIASNAVTAAKLGANLALGYIPIPLTTARYLSSNDIANKATDQGGVLAKNTTPILERVNGATDKTLRISWAANDVTEITFPAIAYPPDLDDTATVAVKLAVAKNTNTNTTTNLAVSYFEGIGGSNAGTSTAVFSVSTLAVYTVTIAASAVSAYPTFATIGLTPAAHANDAIYVVGAWAEYSRKT